MSHLEEQLERQIKLAGLPEYEREFMAIKGRRFKWDFAWQASGFTPALLVEVQGAVWVKGGHSTGTGINRDCEKMNLATLDGWAQMHFTGDQIKSGKAIQWLQEFFRD